MEAPDGQSRASVAIPAVFTSASAPKDPRITQQMDTTTVQHLIQEGLPDAKVEVRDLAGDGEHYAATVVSPSFQGMSRVKQHQTVYAALKGRMGGVLHALALTTSAG